MLVNTKQRRVFDNLWILLKTLVRYNLKIIFANRFFYFLLVAFIIFVLVTVINVLDADQSISAAGVYYLLLVPGLIVIFYPTTFGIQNDVDAGILEVFFGIPNYRYKVWLVRLIIIYAVEFIILLLFSFLSVFALTSFSLMTMVYQLMFPIFFVGITSFMFSTFVRNGYGTAAVMVFICIGFWFLSGFLMESEWNLFLNPFRTPNEVNDVIWAEKIIKNRIYLTIGIVIELLAGLLSLQNREKFV